MLFLYTSIFIALSYLAWRAFLYFNKSYRYKLQAVLDPYALSFMRKLDKLARFVASYESANLFSKWINLTILSFFAILAFLFAKLTRLLKRVSRKLASKHAKHERIVLKKKANSLSQDKE